MQQPLVLCWPALLTEQRILQETDFFCPDCLMLSTGLTGHEEEVSGKREGAIRNELQIKTRSQHPKL